MTRNDQSPALSFKPGTRFARAAATMLFLVLFAVFPPVRASARIVTIDVTQDRQLGLNDCLSCHSDKVDSKVFVNSVHGSDSCTSCHSDIIDIDKHAMGAYKPLPVNCGVCHPAQATDFESSIHKKDLGFDCSTCHTPIHALSKWDRKKVTIIKKCTECHEGVDVDNGHAAAVLRGNEDAAVCADCHGLHNTRRFHTNMNKYPEEARVFYNKTCMNCHGNKEMMRRNNITTIAVDTYEKTYHGKIQKLGYPTNVAGCADCHTSHNILPKSNPHSTVNPANLVKNCGRCHSHASANFVKFKPHADFTNRKQNPGLFWTVFGMTSLLVGTFLFFWLHTALWWRKTYWENYRLKSKGILMDPAINEIENPGEYYTRFRLTYRIMHVTMITAIFGLLFTGMPLKFNGAPWAKTLIGIVGGAEAAGFIHRMMASILVVLFIGAVFQSIRFLFSKKNGATFLERLFSPDSLFFRKKDWEDFRGMLRWFVDMGPMPKFDRWTYWEKFDFLAVFWGMFMIGVSGAILWMPELTARLLPGWIFNVAIIVHSDEAMLAAGFIFTVHFFNTHFIPTKFPMDTVIFTGRIQKYKLIEEKPLHYERLEKAGLLDQMKSEPPDIVTNLVSSALGITFISLGILVVILLVTGLLR